MEGVARCRVGRYARRRIVGDRSGLARTDPDRDLLIFLAFIVILVTLVGQGSTLPLLIRALGVGIDHMAVAQQSLYARRTAVDAALFRITQLADEWPTHLPLIDHCVPSMSTEQPTWSQRLLTLALTKDQITQLRMSSLTGSKN